MHPYLRPKSVGIRGMSPLPDKLPSEEDCAVRCESQWDCVAYTYKAEARTCWLLSSADAQGSPASAQPSFNSGLCSRGSRGVCCLDGARSCDECARGVARTSFCHHAEWACSACTERMQQQQAFASGLPASSLALPPLLYCPPLAPPPPPRPPARGRCCFEPGGGGCDACLATPLPERGGWCHESEAACALCDPGYLFCAAPAPPPAPPPPRQGPAPAAA